jgi:hypothetical protein
MDCQDGISAPKVLWALIQTEQLPCLVLIEYRWTDQFTKGSIAGSAD